MNSQRIYPSKVLLFGEYTVLNGSQALAVPFSGNSGKWTRKKTVPEKYAAHFRDYLLWLRTANIGLGAGKLDTSRMEDDFRANWIYESNIPEGYGLGSSGALCAAILDRYVQDRGLLADYKKLRAALAGLESYFHGKSSGIDPFVSFVEQPVLRQRDRSLHLLNPIRWPDHWGVFLIDSGSARTTSEWVRKYQEKCTDTGFLKKINTSLIPHVEHAIHFMIDQAWELTWHHIRQVSTFQARHFREMIPDPMFALWSSCLEAGHSRMKLCGAGGGGYFLLFSTDAGKADTLLKGYSWIRI